MISICLGQRQDYGKGKMEEFYYAIKRAKQQRTKDKQTQYIYILSSAQNELEAL